ncbi:MAG: hypothetical protein M1823_004362 [Watsoniomyces obsoletus]|nr:MAG: hypothetical protein M1823_004362 [Watsoniomyces obsoletus]
MPYDTAFHGRIPLPAGIKQVFTEKAFYGLLFPETELRQAHLHPGFFGSRVVLAMRNDTVSEINDDLLNGMTGTLQEFLAVDTADVPSGRRR